MDSRLSRERSISTSPFLCYERKACVTVALRIAWLLRIPASQALAYGCGLGTLGAHTDCLLHLSGSASSFFLSSSLDLLS